MPRRRSRRGCDTCRKRHIKCDETLPVCKRCEESRRRCSARPLISLWQNDGVSVPEEKGSGSGGNWLEVPKRLVFVSENADGSLLDSETTQGGSPEDAALDVRERLRTPPESIGSPPVNADTPATAERTLTTTQAAYSTAYEASPRNSISVHSSQFSTPPETSRFQLQGYDHSSPNMPSTWHHRRPLKGRTEAMLIQNFVKELASWFDVTDPSDHFRVVVPERALQSKVVLNALLAISALHLNSTLPKNTTQDAGIRVDPVLADVYHTECIGMLITLINEEESATNDDVLAAAVILRKFEEMRGYVTEKDYGNHLLGVSALFNSRSCAIAGGLAEAAFWQFVRQDAFLSLYLHQPPRIDFSKQDFAFSCSQAPDSGWANRIIYSTVMVLTYCFSDEAKSLAAWRELNRQVNAWDAQRPASFAPIFFEEPAVEEGRFWPDVQFYAPWHATGTQYFHLCKILLSLYRPDTPAPGSGLKYSRAHREMEDAIVYHTRSVCGIAHSNYFPNAKFNMCPIILLCGGWITDVDEQRMVLDVLNNTEKVHAWPTKHVRNSLEEHWGMALS